MAEVESISVAVNLPTDVSQITTTTTTDAAESNAETGQSPTQERSSNSHPHDSEYDTATDLEGAEDYDDEENSITEDEDYDESDEERQKLLEEDAGSSNAEKTLDGEAPKKVDEDRRNPQYIPKRGTFYEHDDREDEVAADAKTTKVLPAPASQPPKARKWQVIPSGDRWSHDRFDACEQAPKSAAELVSAYGYDIRNEEAPPRARRRRRYAKGPTRYQRNWEDENAYQRNNANKERRPPRASDFPALDERGAGKTRKSVNARLQRGGRNEEGENQIETISIDSDQGWNAASHKNQHKFAHEKRAVTSNSGRQQATSQYKTKQRRNHGDQNNRDNFERQQQQQQQKYSNNLTQQQQQQQTKMPAMQNYANENNFNSNNNNNNNNSNNLVENSTVYRLPNAPAPPQQQQQQQLLRQQQQKTTGSGNGATSNLQQRLQQVQSRNDPSHVGSVQMHTLATQNQNQMQQGMHVMPQTPQQQQQQQQLEQQQQQQRGPPKRYSSIRDHQLQQQMQQQQQQQLEQQQQQQHMLAQANLMQHLYHQEKLQAQMQALQVSQPPPPQTVAPGVAKPPNTYATVPGAPPATAQGYAPNNAAAGSVPAAAYYVAAPPPPEAALATNYLPTAPYGPAPAAAGPPAGPYTPPTVSANVSATPAVVGAQPASSANANFGNYQNYNTVGGTTYFVPPAQPPARQVVLPQRRPTNAIPILPPDSSERAKQQQQQRGVGLDAKEDMDSAENIDHIIDNMFVARPVFQPPRKSSSPPVAGEPAEVTLLTDETEKQNELNVSVNVVEQQQQQQQQQPENITTTTTSAAEQIIQE